MHSDIHPLDITCRLRGRQSRKRRRRWRRSVRFFLTAAYLVAITVIMVLSWMFLRLP